MSTHKNLYSIVLAGGSGTRFWPLSRKAKPKQFLGLTGQSTLFEATITRMASLVPPMNIFISSNIIYKKILSQYTRRLGIPLTNILLEPQAKNTAPAICWAAAKIYKLDPRATLVVLPSDHVINNKGKFLACLRQAVDLAQENNLVTFGIVPTRPETGYGYLKMVPERVNGQQVLRVRQFTEKPSLPKAKIFLKNKNYFWNSGIFVWKASVILEAFKQYQPKIYHLLKGDIDSGRIKKYWADLPSVSVDYGILEKAANVVTVKAADIGWSDVGSWEALIEVLAKDKEGNVFRGKVIGLDCRGTLIKSDRLVAAIGLKDLIVVDSPDAILVCHRDKSQLVKETVSVLTKRGYKKWL